MTQQGIRGRDTQHMGETELVHMIMINASVDRELCGAVQRYLALAWNKRSEIINI